jgi:hypothetical protein
VCSDDQTAAGLALAPLSRPAAETSGTEQAVGLLAPSRALLAGWQEADELLRWRFD